MLVQKSLLAMGIVCLVALVVLLWRTRGRSPGRSAVWLLLGILCWHVGTRLPYVITEDDPFPSWVPVLILGGTCALGCACVWFAARYPVPLRWFTVAAGILTIVGIIWASCVLPLHPSIQQMKMFAILLRHHGWLPPLRDWLLLCFALPVVRLGYEAFHVRGYQRLQVRYALSGVLLLIIGLYMNLFFFVRGTLVPIVLLPLVVQGFAISIFAYAFARLPLFNGRVILRLISTVGLAVGLTFFFCSPHYLRFVDFFANAFYQDVATSIILLNICIAFCFLLLLFLLLRVVDWFHMRLSFDERKAAAEISQALLQATDSETVFARLTGILAETMRPMAFAFYLRDSEQQLVRQPVGELEGLPTMFDADDPVLVVLHETNSVQVAELLLQRGRIEETRGRLLMERGIRVVVPLFKEHVWHGCLLLGEKASGDAYESSDLFLLQTISAQASLALENARSHEELEARVAQRTQELAVANEGLREADKAKDRFLALVSHELVNPLTTILAWSEVAQSSDDLPMIKRAIEMIQGGGLQQRRLISDLLDTSRMIHGKLVLQPEPADLWRLVEKTLDHFTHRLQEKHLQIVVQSPEQPLHAYVDPERFQQVIGNLLSNAIKFSPPEGTITVRGWQDASGHVVTVQDTGKGIPAEKLTAIFQLFQQGTGDESFGGLGLGLALVEGIVRLHGGTVTATSLGRDQGSTFTITLPIEANLRTLSALPEAETEAGCLQPVAG